MQNVVIRSLHKDYRTNEAYKTLRTNIEFSGEDNKAIVLTSSTPDEGKSTVSLGLAAALAEGGKKVLFIDADLRKSVLVGRHRVTEEVKGTESLPVGAGRHWARLSAAHRRKDFTLSLQGSYRPIRQNCSVRRNLHA